MPRGSCPESVQPEPRAPRRLQGGPQTLRSCEEPRPRRGMARASVVWEAPRKAQ